MTIKASIGLLSALTIAGAVSWGISTMKIGEIVMEGMHSNREKRLREMLTVQTGDSFWYADLGRVQDQLKKNPWVEDVKIRRLWNGKLVIQIIERKPHAVLSNGKGHFQLIDQDSEIIDRAEPREIGEYPILTGVALIKQIPLRKQALELLAEIPDDGPLNQKNISEINFNEDRGFQMTLTESKIRIRLGKENLLTRLERVRRVVQYLSEHQIMASHIDSDYAKKVLVKVQKPR